MQGQPLVNPKDTKNTCISICRSTLQLHSAKSDRYSPVNDLSNLYDQLKAATDKFDASIQKFVITKEKLRAEQQVDDEKYGEGGAAAI